MGPPSGSFCPLRSASQMQHSFTWEGAAAWLHDASQLQTTKPKQSKEVSSDALIKSTHVLRRTLHVWTVWYELLLKACVSHV